MKQLSIKAILSSLLLLTFLFLALSGALLYFGKTGVVLGFTRHTLRNAHAWAALLMCVLASVHLFLNLRLFGAELRSLSRRKPNDTEKN